MKDFKKVWATFLFLVSASITAQAPQRMSYQAVVRNATGNLVTSTTVGIRIGILQGSASGTSVYTETHNAMTNSNGLVSIEIGGGSIVSGDFGAINWGSGSYFVKMETDPAGGSNYSISGTSQLLSVPYALYAANSRSGGRTSIYLIGDITDADAQTQINEELGPNTENIYIVNTTVLTTVNFNMITTLANLKINNNAALNSIHLNNLVSVYEPLSIDSNPSLAALNLPSLRNLYSDALITNNMAIVAISIPNLNKLSKKFQINSSTVQIIDLSGLVEAKELKFTYVGSLNQLLLPNLSTAFFTLQGGTLMTSYTLPSFTSGSIDVRDNNVITAFHLPNLTNAVSYSTTQNPINFYSNTNLQTVTFPNLSAISGSNKSASFQYNRFNSAQINEILHHMLSVTPPSGKNIDLRSQLPNYNTPLTGQGIIDKQTLVSTGNPVQTN